MTCVELVEVDPDDTKFAQKIMITHENTGCWSYVGRWFEYQRVNLADGNKKIEKFFILYQNTKYLFLNIFCDILM